MCDTIVALAGATADGATLFGKNSDRERNEAQAIEAYPATDHPPGAELRCTYITIPQAAHTQAVLLCRPFWIWGAEMGANEHGVVIGNEAVHARTPPQQEPALIGMDLLRLGLERATTAAEAVDVITGLLERHGQGGSCGHLSPRFYHNSFLIADPRQAFVVETVGRGWIVASVTDARSISNTYSIGRDFERASSPLLAELGAGGDFAAAVGDPGREPVSQGRARCDRSTELLRRARGRLRTADMMAILRDHGAVAETGAGWHPAAAATRTICMHAGDGERGGQTVNSMVSELRDGTALHWVTATAAPCLSIFKPVLIGIGVPAHGPRPTDRFDPHALWWRHERFHRAALDDFAARLAAIGDERDALEASFREMMLAVIAGGTTSQQAETVRRCWSDAEKAEQRWAARLDEALARPAMAYWASWDAMNRAAALY